MKINAPQDDIEVEDSYFRIINNFIPDQLIIKKAEGKEERDITVYDLIARYIGLNYVRENLYRDLRGKYYVRTRFGFQPSELYNQELRLREEKLKTALLERKLQHAEDQLIKLESALEEKREIWRKSFLSLQTSNQNLKNERKQLDKELKTINARLILFEQANNAIVNTVKRLYKIINK